MPTLSHVRHRGCRHFLAEQELPVPSLLARPRARADDGAVLLQPD